MPKSKKTNNSGRENRTVWRTPVKLPTTASSEPMKSLYGQGGASETAAKNESAAVQIVDIAAQETAAINQPAEVSKQASEIVSEEPVRKLSVNAQTRRKTESQTPLTIGNAAEPIAPRRSEAEFLRLLKTDKMDFYSLAEILRGSSMALYCVLYSESLAKGAKGCQIRQNDLMMRARINNPATLYKQERWLTALGLINKSVRLGNHGGASYEVHPLEILPVPEFILAQFEGYFSELR